MEIGNGLFTKIWKDAWLGGEGSGKIITPPSFLSSEAYVCDLIDSGRNCWKKDMITSNFLLKNADDERVWIGNTDGSFRVKDAYRIARKLEDYASCSMGRLRCGRSCGY